MLRMHTVQRPAAFKVANSRARYTVCVHALRARWLLDARYGYKQEATSLLIEWVQTVGAEAGIGPASARISTGALGAPESRLELEVSFDTMADWEAFLSRVPAQQHRAWSQRVQSMVVDGSPKWEVFRVVDVPAASPSETASRSSGAAAAGVAAPAGQALASPWGTIGGGGSSGGSKLVFADKISPEDAAMWALQQRELGRQETTTLGAGSSASSGGGIAPSSTPSSSTVGSPGGTDGAGDTAGDDNGASDDVMLDWKGDPIKWSPGDKVPFKFL